MICFSKETKYEGERISNQEFGSLDLINPGDNLTH